MIILRIFINSEDLLDNTWQLLDNNQVTASGREELSLILEQEFEQVEVYLAPELATIIKVDLGQISDRKINDELLLSLVEDSLAEDIEHCKPILMRLTDGDAYVAVMNRQFHGLLINSFSDHIKSVKHIQPFPYVTRFETDIWTLHLHADAKFIRTSRYDYYLLDDSQPLPELLEQMLATYTQSQIIVYSDNPELVTLLESKYNLKCNVETNYEFSLTNWNFYNEKSRRFAIKLNDESQARLTAMAKVFALVAGLYCVGWLADLGYLIYQRSHIESSLGRDLQGVVAVNNYSPNLLAQVDDKLTSLQHSKGVYAASDFANLFEEFLRTVPNIDSNMIVGTKYASNQLQIFLNSQFDRSRFINDQAILATKRIRAEIQDYKSYQAAENQSNKNNNGGGVLDNTNENNVSKEQMADSAWVVTLQVISRMDELNHDDSNTRTVK